MAQSVQKTIYGPAWPLGLIVVPTPGTPVNIMSLVDGNNVNAPQTPNAAGQTAGLAYTPTCHKIFVQGYTQNANNNGLIPNVGNVYLCVQGLQGAGNKSDYGSVVYVVPPGGMGTFPAAETQLDTLSPYKFWLDVDNANDAGLVSLMI